MVDLPTKRAPRGSSYQKNVFQAGSWSVDMGCSSNASTSSRRIAPRDCLRTFNLLTPEEGTGSHDAVDLQRCQLNQRAIYFRGARGCKAVCIVYAWTLCFLQGRSKLEPPCCLVWSARQSSSSVRPCPAGGNFPKPEAVVQPVGGFDAVPSPQWLRRVQAWAAFRAPLLLSFAQSLY